MNEVGRERLGRNGGSFEREEEEPLYPVIAELERTPGTRSARVVDVRVGPFWTAVATSLGTGIASTLCREAYPHRGAPVGDAGRLRDSSALELARLSLPARAR